MHIVPDHAPDPMDTAGDLLARMQVLQAGREPHVHAAIAGLLIAKYPTVAEAIITELETRP